MQRRIRRYRIDAPLRHSGNVGELVERCKWSVKLPVFDDPRGKCRADTRKRRNARGVSSVDIDSSTGSGPESSRGTPSRGVRRRFPDTRNANLFAVGNAIGQIHSVWVGIGAKTSGTSNRIVDARAGRQRIQSGMDDCTRYIDNRNARPGT